MLTKRNVLGLITPQFGLRCTARLCRALLLMLAIAGVHSMALAATDPADIPLLRCPKLRTAPTIDGRIDPGEWSGAAGLSAMVNARGETASVAAPIQQAHFYMGYDDKYLYLAMHSPHKDGTYPLARCKKNDDMAMLFEDHIEFQVLKGTRVQSASDFGFYKMMVNPRGIMVDQRQWLYPGAGYGVDNLWSTGGRTKCTVTPTYWDMEMTIELAQLGLDKLDGHSLAVWLCRSDSCQGTAGLTWGPPNWTGWDTMPEVTFDPSSPAVQLAGVGGIMRGNPAVVFSLSDTAGKSHAISGSLKILNKAGQMLCDEHATVELSANGKSSLRLAKKSLQIDEDGNTVFLEVREGDTVLYYNKMPLARMTDAYRKNVLAPWVNSRPRLDDWDCNFAARPGGMAECSVNLDLLGMSEKMLKADACEVEILAENGTSIAKDRFSIVNRAGSVKLKRPDLVEGDGKARFTLYEGSKKIGQKELPSLKMAAFASDSNERSIDAVNDNVQPNLAEDATEGRQVDTYHQPTKENWGYDALTKPFIFYVVHPRHEKKGSPLCVVLHSLGHDAYTAMRDGFARGADGTHTNCALFYTPEDSYGLYMQSDASWWGRDIPGGPGGDQKRYAIDDNPLEKRVMDTIAWVIDKYNIDADRVHLAGLSMGGSGGLGIGMRHGDVFASAMVWVPAGTQHMARKLFLGEKIPDGVTIPDPPVLLDVSSQTDLLSGDQGVLLKSAAERKYAVVLGWGPFGHASDTPDYVRYCPSVFFYPWLEIRRNEAYPVFIGATSDQKAPWLYPQGSDDHGQMNAYFRWKSLEDTATEFTMRIWIENAADKNATPAMPNESTANITLRRLQKFKAPPGKDCSWELVRQGKVVASGVIQPDSSGLLTVPKVMITTVPTDILLKVKGK